MDRAIAAVFDVAHPMPGCDRKLLDVLSELLRRGYPEPSYLSPQYFSWGQIALCQGGGSITNGISHDLVLWTSDQSLTPLCGSVREIADHLDHLRDSGWSWAFCT